MFSENALSKSGQFEVATTRETQMVIAKIKARWVMAIQRPRDMEVVKKKVLELCTNGVFAENCTYHVKVGSKKNEETKQWESIYDDDFNIRAAEQFRLCYMNTDSEAFTTYEDGEIRRVATEVTDLENNTTYRDEFTIYKIMERQKLYEDQEPLSERMNSEGKLVYTVKCTPDDVHKKQKAQESKSFRKLFFRLFPIDLKLNAMVVVEQTILEEVKKNPKSSKENIIKAFKDYGIEKGELEKYLKKTIEKINEKDVVLLRKIYVAIRDGEATWKDYLMREKEGTTHVDLSGIKDQGESKKEPSTTPEPAKQETSSLGEGDDKESPRMRVKDAYDSLTSKRKKQFLFELFGENRRKLYVDKLTEDLLIKADNILNGVSTNDDSTVSPSLPPKEHRPGEYVYDRVKVCLDRMKVEKPDKCQARINRAFPGEGRSYGPVFFDGMSEERIINLDLILKNSGDYE